MEFSEAKPLIHWEDDKWTVGDAMRGVAIFGGTGSGKTSGSGRTLALKYLKEGWGGLVLCVKTDEADLWEEYCKEAHRSNDMIRFKNGSILEGGKIKKQLMVFNPIDYELKRAGEGAGDPQNITNIFMNIYRMGNRIAGGGDNREERFWDVALKRCISRVVELLILAKEDLSFENMRRVLVSCKELEPIEIEDIKKGTKETYDLNKLFKYACNEAINGSDQYDYRGNYCFDCLLSAYLKIDKKDPAKTQAFNLVHAYFLHEFGSLGGRVRSTISESFMGLAEPFLSGLLFRHFAGVTNLFPEVTFTERKIIVLDFSVKEFLDAGIVAQSIYKMMFQQAVERREVKKYPTPVFLWADESQMFVNPYDQIFLTTARSKRVATVFLTQNIPNFLSVMGSGMEAKAKVDSLLGNLSTKIFHNNMDAETNEYASRLIGNALLPIMSTGKQKGELAMSGSVSEGVSYIIRPQVFPKEFISLKAGGDQPKEEDKFMVEGFVVMSGRSWEDGESFKLVRFDQNYTPYER